MIHTGAIGGDPLQIPEHWTFENKSVADNFDGHVREQLPWYDLATEAACEVVRHFAGYDARVYDIGAATGNIGRRLDGEIKARRWRFTGIESAAEMVEKYRATGKIVHAKAQEFDFEPFDVAICFLCLIFISVEDRAKVFDSLLRQCRRGGALVILEKMTPSGGYLATINHRLTMAGKIRQGVDPEEVLAKELSLAGIQRPMSRDELPQGAVEFFRYGDFAGYIIERTDGDRT